MEELAFLPKNKKTGSGTKAFSVFLLTMGASSVIDIEKVVLSDKLTVKVFLAEDIIMNLDDIRIINDKSGSPKAIVSKTDRLELAKMDDPAGLVKAIMERKEENKMNSGTVTNQ